MQRRRIAIKQKKSHHKEVRFQNKRRTPEEQPPPAAEADGRKKKRSDETEVEEEAAAATSAAAPTAMVDPEQDQEAQEYADQFEDEIEDTPAPAGQQEEAEEEEKEEEGDDDNDDDEQGDEDGTMDMSAMGEALPQQRQLEVWDPETRPLEEGEELVCDPKVYDMLHRMTPEWPCLSFDVLRDTLGQQRTRFPHTAYVVAGTQAAQANKNKITLMKISDMHRTRHQRAEDDSGSDTDGDDTDDDVDDDPVLESRDIKHDGGVNRIRAMPQHPGIVASWSERGKVYVWDLQPWLAALDTPPVMRLPPTPRPMQSLNHKTEGFALDWSPLSAAEGCLLSGDGSGSVYLWRPNAGQQSWSPEGPFIGHGGSVEDLQWSPNEPAVFASCSADHTVRVWDARTKTDALRMCQAHSADVNVISWNKLRPFLMASGGDDGAFRVWDLRSFHEGTPVSDFRWHKKPITSVEWSPDDESVLAVASADNSVSIWDFSLEDDPEATATATSTATPTSTGSNPPPQLVFVHMGQLEIKELHWHPQITKTLVSTASDGFNIFKPSNI